MNIRTYASLILHDGKKNILMQHRSADARKAPNQWGSFGGKVEEGETPLEALMRESYEELEYQPRDPKFLFIEKTVFDGELSIQHVFLERYDDKQPLIQHEGDEMRWVDVESVREMAVTKPSLVVLPKIFKYLDENS